ncbi:hypothetical protein B0A52_10289 [Exophiala mesophila]|uniref:Aquaporin n=1 Tax=Exophiala mesophila TaxID=212818 RepID=A0A438MQG8_EXOME|nr:hypothetical protein B0A52_10289 [Exophiala mesophila]
MDNLKTGSGFLPGLFGSRSNAPRGTSSASNSQSEKTLSPKPSPIFKRLPDSVRNHFIAMAGEFVGTFLFLFFAFSGTQVANTPATSAGDDSEDVSSGPNPAQLLYISLVFGFSLAVNAWIFFRISGGLFNPAVTLGLCLIGAVPFARGGLVVIAQMLGAMVAAAVVKGLFPGPLSFLTTQLVFTIFMLAAEKHKGTFLAPVGIGLSLFIAELSGVYYTGGSLNPARSFGPCVANASFPPEHWIYWLGPILGALLASGFFWFIKSCEYQSANPGQDFDDLEASAFNPDEDLSRPVVSPTVNVDSSRVNSRDGPTRSSGDDRMASLMDRVESGRTPDYLGAAMNNSSYTSNNYQLDGNQNTQQPQQATSYTIGGPPSQNVHQQTTVGR